MSEAWATFAAHPERAPDLAATWAMVEACAGAPPHLALRLIAHHLASPWATPPWAHLLDPLLALPGIAHAWRAARDPATGLGLALAGRLDPGEVTPAMIDAYVAAVAAGVDASADVGDDDGAGRAVALQCDDGARLLGRAGFAARLDAAIAPAARLPVALVTWLGRDEPDPARRVRWALRAADLDGPRPAIAPADRAALAALLAAPEALDDDDARAAGIAAEALALALPVATWDALVREAHLAHGRDDLDEPAIDVVRALHHISPARRTALSTAVPGFAWHHLRAAPTPPPRPMPAPLRRVVDEAWHRLHADALAQLPRSHVARILAALDDGAPCAFVPDGSVAEVLAARPELAGAGRLAQRGPLPTQVVRANRRARIARLFELRAPEVVIAPELERLRLAERAPGRLGSWAAACVYPRDPETAGLARRLRLAHRVGVRLLPRWRAAFPDDDLAPRLLDDLARLARGEPRVHAHLGARAEQPGDDPAWAIAAFLFAAAEHHDGAPTLTLQDTPLDLAQQALMPEGFGSPAGADLRLAFWRWWLAEALPAVW